jgi:hypothetical protein
MGSSESVLGLHCSSPKLFPQTLCHHCMPLLHLRSLAYSPFQVVIRALNSVAWIALREWELGTAGIFAELALESM